jgi:AraC family transcriptional regulator, regulatory protein of adaptative response / methylated-DNA-[protein]-cysteine methyltransferase
MSRPSTGIPRKIRIDVPARDVQNGSMKPEALWQKVLDRDARWDGRFVYAVESTGIYCRPSCASRRPRRRGVTFFGGPAEAERAGYRACLRCGGRPPDRTTSAEVVRRACAVLDRLPSDTKPTLVALARRVGVGPFQLHRLFRSALGISPREYAEAKRAGRLKTLLRNNETVTSALYEAGYGSSSRLYERADAELGMTPAAYRRGGLGMDIHYTIVRSTLGHLLVGATERGVCSVKLGSAANPLADDLRREYPNATIEDDLGKLSPAVTALVDYLAGQAPAPDLPLDVQGTAFQRRVWVLLQRIPAGTTMSYGEVARALGRPRAARAVARACATNHAALVIPCHRVVQTGGGLGGYRWGAARKRRLLEVERTMGASPRSRARAEAPARG